MGPRGLNEARMSNGPTIQSGSNINQNETPLDRYIVELEEEVSRQSGLLTHLESRLVHVICRDAIARECDKPDLPPTPDVPLFFALRALKLRFAENTKRIQFLIDNIGI